MECPLVKPSVLRHIAVASSKTYPKRSIFQSSLFDENRGIKREAAKDESAPTHPTPTKKHRWLPADELEESRNGRSKAYGRVHCKATYKCAVRDERLKSNLMTA